VSDPRLLAEPAALRALEGARAVVFLVGSYDASANYGDIAQFDAAVELTARLGPRVALLAVIEAGHRATHEHLYGERQGFVPLYFTAEPAPDPAGMEPATLPPGLRAAAAYLYGGGYLNPAWGPRKLAMLTAVEALAGEAGVALAGTVASGLQIDGDWLAGLDADTAAPLRRVRSLGARDAASAATVAALGRGAALTGDDAVGRLLPWIGSAHGSGAAVRRVNVHVSTSSWVTGDGDPLLAFSAAVVAALAGDGEVTIQPVVAYDDARTSERPAAARLRELCVAQGVPAAAFAEPLLARPADLEPLTAAMSAADLTLSCSYHVALTSLMLGVPAALVAENGYYAQKSAGLRSDFGLSGAWVLDPGDDAAEAARRLVTGLPDAAAATARAAAPVAGRRLAAERDLLAELAEHLLAGAVEGGGAGGGDATLALAVLRAEHQSLLHGFRARGRRLRELDADRERHAADVAEAEQSLARERAAREHFEAAAEHAEAARREAAERRAALEHRLAVVEASRSWRLLGGARRAAAALRRLR
jgi:hypothetical protein